MGPVLMKSPWLLKVAMTVCMATMVTCDWPAWEREAPSNNGQYATFAIASDNQICSDIGKEIHDDGGNTADVAIAVMFCLGAVHPHSSGLGGGFIGTIYNRTSMVAKTLIAREKAPLEATADMFLSASSTSGGLSIGVPGELAGLRALYQEYGGALPWKKLVKPSIQLLDAKKVVVSKSLDQAIHGRENDIRNLDALSRLYLDNDNILTWGDSFGNKWLADTLKVIANDMGCSFYDGDLGDDIVQDIQEQGGIITKADLYTYNVAWEDPVIMTLSHGDYTLYGPPPPSSASILYYALAILNGYQFGPGDRLTEADEGLIAHRTVEALKFAFGKRSQMGDSKFVDVTDLLALVADTDFAELTRQKINDSTVLPLEDYEPGFYVSNTGTTHMSVTGPDGISIGITSTINRHFGSKVNGLRTGIHFNDEMDDFSTPGQVNTFGFPPSLTNFIEPGKRPMSSTSPTIMVDSNGDLISISGASGGSRIISTIVLTLMNDLWFGKSSAQSVDESRYHHQLDPMRIQYEDVWVNANPNIISFLTGKGHVNYATRSQPKEFSSVNYVRNRCNEAGAGTLCIEAVSDWRKGGGPSGV